MGEKSQPRSHPKVNFDDRAQLSFTAAPPPRQSATPTIACFRLGVEERRWLTVDKGKWGRRNKGGMYLYLEGDAAVMLQRPDQMNVGVGAR